MLIICALLYVCYTSIKRTMTIAMSNRVLGWLGAWDGELDVLTCFRKVPPATRVPCKGTTGVWGFPISLAKHNLQGPDEFSEEKVGKSACLLFPGFS
jgi:hypothetical protein